MRNQKEINEYMKEAHDRVWMIRKQALFDEEFGKNNKHTDEELIKLQEEICYICKEYDVDFYNSVNDFYNGYWTGILSALRWVNGDRKDFMEV